MTKFTYKGILEYTGYNNVAMVEGDNPVDIMDELRKIKKSLCMYKDLNSYIIIIINETNKPVLVESCSANSCVSILDIAPEFRETFETYANKNCTIFDHC